VSKPLKVKPHGRNITSQKRPLKILFPVTLLSTREARIIKSYNSTPQASTDAGKTPQCPHFNTIQMMHGSEWTLKYDEPEVENVARGLRPGFHNTISLLFFVYKLYKKMILVLDNRQTSDLT